MSLLEREKDTICAIATPVGPGGIGIVRISGKDAPKILKKVFKPKRNITDFESHRLYYGHVQDPDSHEIIDECMAVLMRAPHSYTREDVVELQSHSGHAVLKRILDLTISQGARLAEPGEFTKRAFINGRIDLAQAEALLDLINAQTEEERRLAVSTLMGKEDSETERIRNVLLELLAHLEVAIDFPDEDVEILDEGHLASRLENEVLNPIKQLIHSYEQGRILREGALVVFGGRPNVGKSSIFNAILGMGRVIVSPIPGTTRDTIEEAVDIEGLRIVLVDTAGIRPKDKVGEDLGVDIVEAQGIELSLSRLKDAHLVLVVFDLSEELKDEDFEVFSYLPEDAPFLVIFNKADLVDDPEGRFKKMEEVLVSKFPFYAKKRGSILVSAQTGLGLKELKKALFEAIIGEGGSILKGHGFVPNLRQKECLERAFAFAERARDGLNKGRPLEVVAMDVRDVLRAFDEVMGRGIEGDLLDKIFSNFCLGK